MTPTRLCMLMAITLAACRQGGTGDSRLEDGAAEIDAEDIRAHVELLADDLLEGRGTGTPCERTSPACRSGSPACRSWTSAPTTRAWATTSGGFRIDPRMVIDTSAVVAIFESEPASPRLIEALEATADRRMSAASLVEVSIVMLSRYGEHGGKEVDLFLQRAQVDVAPVNPDHAEIARSAYRRFGKGRHPAAINFGDCFSYALAIAMGEPLLFVGTNFELADVEVAVH